MTRWPVPILLAAFFSLPSGTDEPAAEKKAAENAKSVARTLRAHLPAQAGVDWSEFQLRIVDRIGESEYAVAAGWERWADGKETPYVQLTHGFLRAYGDSPDALAAILGHAFGSLARGHAPRKAAESRLGGSCANRRREADADLFAAELLLKSGYSLRSAITHLTARLNQLPAAVQGATKERVERLTRILDGTSLDANEELWRLMPALDAGLVFRAAQQYRLAETCFASVLHEFPRNREVWALLTVSRLMRYQALLAPPTLPPRPLRVTLRNGKTVGLGEDTDEMLTKLGKPTRTTPAAPGTKLKRFWFQAHGIAVLAGDESLAVVLLAKGPAVKWPSAEGKPGGTLRAGMVRSQVEKLPGGKHYSPRPFQPLRAMVSAYYPAHGIAVIYEGDGPDDEVVSIVVVGSSGR